MFLVQQFYNLLVKIKHKFPQRGYTGGNNMDKKSAIFVSSNVPTYNIQHPLHIDTYIILVAK